MPKLADPRRVKKNYSYTVGEAALCIGVHPNTVRMWMKSGLPHLKDRKPLLIIGEHMIAFLTERRRKNRQPLKVGQIFCVKCRAPKVPDGHKVYYRPQTNQLGSLYGYCPDCTCLMNRRVNLQRLEEIVGNLDVQFPHGRQCLTETNSPSANSDFKP